MEHKNMWNDEDLSRIIIKNKKGKVIATLSTETLNCNNKKFKISPGHYEDEIVIQLMQETYR